MMDSSKGDSLSPVGMYLFRLALGLDQFLNVVFAGFPDESISGRAGRAIATGRPKWFVPPLCKILDWIFYKMIGEVGHCANSIEHEEKFHSRKELWRWYHEEKKG